MMIDGVTGVEVWALLRTVDGLGDSNPKTPEETPEEIPEHH